MNKKHLVTLSTSVMGAFFMAFLFVFSPPQLQSLDNSLRDIFFQIRGEIPTTGEVVIIDIDEKSLATFGQWPWERNLVAQLIQQLSDDGAGIIGLDIVFSEKDKTSPAYLNQKHSLNIDNPQDYDEILGNTVGNTPTILGYVFMMNDKTPNTSPPSIPGIVIEQNTSTQSFMLEAQGVLPNTSAIQDKAYSSGFFNNLPDPSGMVRNVPLIIKFNNAIYPSLALEMLRVAHQSPSIKVRSSEIGVESIQIGDLSIPTNRYGQLFVNYRGPAHTFSYISAADVLNNQYDKTAIDGKWLLIGTSASALLDLRSMPFDNAYPGVEAHANVIDNILMGDTLTKPSWIEAADLLIIVSVFLLSYLVFNSLGPIFLTLSAILGFTGLYFFMDYMLFTEGIILNILMPFSALTLALILSTLFNFFFESRQKDLIKSKLASKVSSSVMNEILKNQSLDIMQGQTREITVFFSDLRGFTNLSEAISNPQVLIQFLNEYTTAMTNIIVEKQGTIDKFIGDSIMAYWNAPIELNNHADLAVTAGLKQLAELTQLNTKIKQNPLFKEISKYCKQENIEPIEIGIGLNTGDAVVGEMGSAGRSDYTVIGDTVNLSSRLESLCKFYGSTLNISQYTKAALKEEYSFRFIDKVTVKGKKQTVEIWQVHGFGQPTERLKEELDSYHQAIALYQNSQFAEALKNFEELQTWQDKTNQKIYGIYIERCKHYISDSSANFDGVYQHTTKT